MHPLPARTPRKVTIGTTAQLIAGLRVVRVNALKLVLGWRVLSGIFTEHGVRPMQHEGES